MLNTLKIWWRKLFLCEKCQENTAQCFGLCKDCIRDEIDRAGEEIERCKDERLKRVIKDSIREIIQEND